MSARLPRRSEELVASWLTGALNVRYPGVEVTSLRFGSTIGGTATKVQLLPEYNDIGIAAGLPRSLYAKGGFDWHEASFANSYIAEAIFYAEWAPQVSANIPKCYFAGHDSGQGIVLLEDLSLRQASFTGGRVEPLDADTVAQVLTVLARLHAVFWQLPTLTTLRSLGQRVGTNFIDHFLAPEYYARCLAKPQGGHIPEQFHDPARMLAALRANWAQADTGPQSFCHGDAHMGNLYFEPGGAAGLLDFQAYVRSGPLHDVSYHVVGSLSPTDRRRQERDLLQHYLAELDRSGVTDRWSFEEAWLRFRKHAMHGLLWFATPEEMQPAAIVAAHGERFGTAAEDYNLVELLDV